MIDQQQPTTQSSAFTPGPWHIEEYRMGGTYCMIQASDGLTVATTTATVNARLIAEAPAMLGLLQKFVTMHRYSNAECGCDLCSQARPILKRVQGG